MRMDRQEPVELPSEREGERRRVERRSAVDRRIVQADRRRFMSLGRRAPLDRRIRDRRAPPRRLDIPQT